MKNIYIKVRTLLENIPTDKYIHFNVCLFISFALMRIFPLPKWVRFIVAVVTTILVGIGKEVYDYYDYGLFDCKDLLADCIGAVAGATLGMAV